MMRQQLGACMALLGGSVRSSFCPLGAAEASVAIHFNAQRPSNCAEEGVAKIGDVGMLRPQVFQLPLPPASDCCLRAD